MDRQRVRILVTGGGVGSQVVAAFLEQSGYGVTRALERTERSAGVPVAPNGARVLAALAPGLLSRGTVTTRQIVRDHRGEVVSESEGGTTFVPRAALASALVPLIRAEERPALTELPTEFDLVVGVDGARSPLRALMGQPAVDSPWSMISFHALGDPNDTTAVRVLGNGATASHAPIGHGQRLVRVVVPAGTELQGAREAVGPACAPLFDGIVDGTLRVERLVEKAPQSLHVGAVLLLGSAAHPLHPLFDQDPSMTFEDGRALQMALDQSDSVAAAIHAYLHMRKERVHEVVKASWELAKAGEKKSGFAASFRGVLHKLAPSLWPSKPAALSSTKELDELVSHRPDLTKVTPEGRQFLAFLVKIGQVDGRFDEAERAFVRASLRETGHYATEEEIATIEDEVRKRMTRELVRPFKQSSLEVREHVLHAGVLLAATSGRIASDEHKALREAAHEMELPEGTLARLTEAALAAR